MKCLDTTYLIDFLQGRLANPMSGEFTTTQINVFEVLLGVHRRAGRKKEEELMYAERLFQSLQILPLTDVAIRKAAEIAGQLILAGKEIGQNDCLTAAIALSQGIPVIVTQDVEHFNRIPGITVEEH